MGVRHRIQVATVVGALALIAALGGCTTSTTCVDWVAFETPQDAFDDAAAVVIAESEPTGETGQVYGAPVPTYELDVIDVLKGAVDEGRLEVASTQITCSADGEEYPDGRDPLDADGRLIVFLFRSNDGQWRTITPFDGVLPLPDDGTLPLGPDDH